MLLGITPESIFERGLFFPSIGSRNLNLDFLYVFFCIVAAFVFIKRYYTFEKII